MHHSGDGDAYRRCERSIFGSDQYSDPGGRDAKQRSLFLDTGVLSSFLDNAPTYLVFFQLAGGDPVALMGPLAKTLTAISLGAVFMGANTYIGNAPNFMVYAIARRAGMNMPGFFPYMIWSGAILFPVFAAIDLAVPDVEPDEHVPRTINNRWARRYRPPRQKRISGLSFPRRAKRRMALTFDGKYLRARVPGRHFVKRFGRKQIRVCASEDKQGHIT